MRGVFFRLGYKIGFEIRVSIRVYNFFVGKCIFMQTVRS